LRVNIISPGRINLIGEHTDYNGGYVLPCAINLSVNLYFEIQNEKSYVSTDIGYSMSFNVDELSMKSDNQWENYVIGVVRELKKIKSRLKNFYCKIESTLPSGAGISSSSALVCGLIKGLNVLNDLNLNNSDVINISRNVEHKHIGVLGGIMDQYTILNAKKNKAILLNCKNLNAKYIDIDFGEYEILLLDSKIKHNLANTEYNERVKECNKALATINSINKKKIECLSDVSLDEIKKSKNNLSEKEIKRATFVVEENFRVIKSSNLIENNNLIEFGKLMYKSHEGLRNKYEVSCKELDFLVDQSKIFDEILGARMMGGGFGGCTVNLVKKSATNKIIRKIKDNYESHFGINLNAIIAKPGSGIMISKF